MANSSVRVVHQRLVPYLIPYLSVGAVVVAWHILVRVFPVSTDRFPSPMEVLTALGMLVASGQLLSDTASTVSRVVFGLLIGGPLGFLVGLGTGTNSRIFRALNPILQVSRPIPAVALVTVATYWLGIGDALRVFVIAWAAFFPLWLSTHIGVGRVPPEFRWTAQLLGASPSVERWRIVVPWALPFIASGLRLAIGSSVAASVAAEMSGAAHGLGFRISIAYQNHLTDQMLAALFTLGCIGATIDVLVQRLNARVAPWAADAGANDAFGAATGG
jgi:ABC-type nitrate/sulfonate/bicarbonate transport system permease component